MPAYPAQRDAYAARRKPLPAILRVWAGGVAARYDAVLDLSGGKWSAAVTGASRARHRVGFADTRWSWCYNRRLDRPAESADGPHALDRYAVALRAVDAEPGARPRAVRLSAADAESGLDPARRWVVMHPFAGKTRRQWPAERFAQVARRLIDTRGVGVLVVGAPGDRAAGRALATRVQRPEAVHFRCPPLPQLLAIFGQAALLISNESGPTHLVATTRVPIVTIFGPTAEAAWRPLRDDRLTLLRGAACHPGCAAAAACVAEPSCLTALTVDAVQAAANAYLSPPPRPQRNKRLVFRVYFACKTIPRPQTRPPSPRPRTPRRPNAAARC